MTNDLNNNYSYTKLRTKFLRTTLNLLQRVVKAYITVTPDSFSVSLLQLT